MSTQRNDELQRMEEVWSSLANCEALGEIVERVRRSLNGAAAVVWKPSKTIKRQADHPSGRLYAYSSTFGVGDGAHHAAIVMDLERDTTGRFYASEEKIRHGFINDFPHLDIQSPARQFMERAQLQHVCLAKFTMRPGTTPDSKPKETNKQEEYAVSVYRRADQLPFTESDAERLGKISCYLPALYSHLVDSQLKNAVVSVNKILRGQCDSIKIAREKLQQLCVRLAEHFHCYEVTIYLREPMTVADVFDLAATTLDATKVTKKRSAKRNEGVTSYVLATGESVWFHDLRNFRDPERGALIRAEYPGIEWHDTASLGSEARRLLKVPATAPEPTLPFAAVPIKSEDGKIFGVLRCCLGNNPFYFIPDELQILDIIGEEIAGWWALFGHSLEQVKRADIWQLLNTTLREQHEVLRKERPDDAIDTDLLANQTVHSVAKDETFSVAAFRRGETLVELKLVTAASKTGAISVPPGTVVPFGQDLLLPANKRGFHTISQVRTARQIAEGTSELERKLFVGAEIVLSLAIMIHRRLYGVFDVGFKSEREFLLGRDHFELLLDLVARQLGLFERVSVSVEAVKEAQENELKTYETVTHQLKSPLYTAHTRLRAMVGNSIDPRLRPLLQIAGMVDKAQRVTNTIEMLGRIVRKDRIAVNMEGRRSEELRRMCIEIAQNQAILSEEAAGLSFLMEQSLHWSGFTVMIDQDCTEQSIDAVVSNAFKYSHPKQAILLTARNEGGYLIVKVTSRGITMTKDDAAQCIIRGWRGSEAKKQKGAGIGLWLTKHLMDEQGGELRVHPTNNRGETVIELAFQLRKGPV